MMCIHTHLKMKLVLICSRYRKTFDIRRVFKLFLHPINLQLKPFELHSLFTFQECSCQQTFSQPPTYWNESQIVKKLDSSGVGRPSTYASIIATLYNRHYTEIKNIPEKERSCIQFST